MQSEVRERNMLLGPIRGATNSFGQARSLLWPGKHLWRREVFYLEFIFQGATKLCHLPQNQGHNLPHPDALLEKVAIIPSLPEWGWFCGWQLFSSVTCFSDMVKCRWDTPQELSCRCLLGFAVFRISYTISAHGRWWGAFKSPRKGYKSLHLGQEPPPNHLLSTVQVT